MARRRAPEAPALGDSQGVPPELLVGRCLEVWAEDLTSEGAWRSAWRRWDAARVGWLQEQGVASTAGHIDWHQVRARFGRTLADRAPWSIRTLDDEGRSPYVDARLGRAGVRREDVPELRRWASVRVAEGGQLTAALE